MTLKFHLKIPLNISKIFRKSAGIELMKLFSRAAVTDPKLNISLIHSIGLLLIFGAALAMRFYPLVAAPEKIRGGFGPFGDSFLYHQIAYNLYQGNGYSGIDNGSAYGFAEPDTKTVYEPAITRGPVYPFFLYLVYRIWGDPAAMKSIIRWHVNWNRVRVVQSVLDALICLLLFYVMRVLYPEHNWPAFLSAGLYAFSFYNIFYTRMLLSEAITTFLVTVATLAALMALKSERNIYWFFCGAGLGLTNLSRPEYILFPVCLAGFLLLRPRHQLKKAIKTSLLLWIGVIAVMAPWTLRNYLTFNQFIPASIGAIGFNLFNGTYENGDWEDWGKFPEHIFKTQQMKKEVTDLSAKVSCPQRYDRSPAIRSSFPGTRVRYHQGKSICLFDGLGQTAAAAVVSELHPDVLLPRAVRHLVYRVFYIGAFRLFPDGTRRAHVVDADRFTFCLFEPDLPAAAHRTPVRADRLSGRDRFGLGGPLEDCRRGGETNALLANALQMKP